MHALLLSVLTLALTGTPTPSPTKTPKPVAAQMVIWGGGKTRVAAEKSAKKLEAVFPKVEHRFNGFPETRIIESATVDGLNPGFHIVVLATCDEPGAEALLKVFRPVAVGVYARRVMVPAGDIDCPSVAPSPTKTVMLKQGKLTLQVSRFEDAPEDVEGEMVASHYFHGTLKNAAGDELDRFFVDAILNDPVMDEYGCEGTVRKKGSTIVVHRDCPSTGYGDCWYSAWTQTWTLKIEGEGIGIDEQQTGERGESRCDDVEAQAEPPDAYGEPGPP